MTVSAIHAADNAGTLLPPSVPTFLLVFVQAKRIQPSELLFALMFMTGGITMPSFISRCPLPLLLCGAAVLPPLPPLPPSVPTFYFWVSWNVRLNGGLHFSAEGVTPQNTLDPVQLLQVVVLSRDARLFFFGGGGSPRLDPPPKKKVTPQRSNIQQESLTLGAPLIIIYLSCPQAVARYQRIGTHPRVTPGT